MQEETSSLAIASSMVTFLKLRGLHLEPCDSAKIFKALLPFCMLQQAAFFLHPEESSSNCGSEFNLLYMAPQSQPLLSIYVWSSVGATEEAELERIPNDICAFFRRRASFVPATEAKRGQKSGHSSGCIYGEGCPISQSQHPELYQSEIHQMCHRRPSQSRRYIILLVARGLARFVSELMMGVATFLELVMPQQLEGALKVLVSILDSGGADALFRTGDAGAFVVAALPTLA